MMWLAVERYGKARELRQEQSESQEDALQHSSSVFCLRQDR